MKTRSGIYACNREEGHRVTLYARVAASRATKRFAGEDLATMLDSIKERIRKCSCAFKALFQSLRKTVGLGS